MILDAPVSTPSPVQRFRLSLVILETMWGPADGFRPLFVINPKNKSGGRLYRLFGDHKFVVGNACDGIVEKATMRGKPSVGHLVKVLKYAEFRSYDLQFVLIGGKVAKATFEQLPPEVKPQCPVLCMPHPAARFWTKEGEKRTGELIRKILTDGPMSECELGHDMAWSGAGLSLPA